MAETYLECDLPLSLQEALDRVWNYQKTENILNLIWIMTK